MMKLRSLALATALVLSPAPAMAQNLNDIFGPGPNPITMFKELFEAPPLTPAEQVRLPAAQQLADSLVPPGSYGKMVEDSFGPMTEKVMGMIEADTETRAAQLVGLTKYDLEARDDAELEAVIAMLDPRAAERNKKMADFVLAEFAGAMVKVEPFYRDGLARAYAKNFDAGQLAEINAFFATPTGNRYAATSMAMYMDPQVMAEIPDMMPAIVGHVAEAATRFMLAMDTIPQARDVGDLSRAERTRLLGLLGMTEDEYEAAKYSSPMFDIEPAIMPVPPAESEFGEDWEAGYDEAPAEGGLEEVE